MTDDQIIEKAKSILLSRMRVSGDKLTSPQAAAQYVTLHLAERQHEVFSAVFLDTKHCAISIEDMFHGTIDGTAVYPRVVVARALELGAGAVIFAHNHPSGDPDPSSADKVITKRLKEALKLFDIRVLDHFVVGLDDPKGYYSFSEHGLL